MFKSFGCLYLSHLSNSYTCMNGSARAICLIGPVWLCFVSFCSGTWPQPKPFQASIDWVKSDFQSEWNEEIYKHTGHKVHGKNHLIYTIIRLFLVVVHLFIGVALSRCLVFFCRVDFDGVLCVLMIFFFFEEFNQMIRARCLMQHVDFIILFLYRKYFLCLVFKITRRSTQNEQKIEKRGKKHRNENVK